MRTISQKQKKKDYNIYLLGDIHEGRVGVAHDKLDVAIDMIQQDKGSKAALMGDLIEAIPPFDKRYSPWEQEGTYSRMTEQCEAVAEMLMPIKKQIISLLVGNHEEKVDEIMNCGTEIGKKLGLDFHTDSRTNVVEMGNGLKLYLTHGSGSTNSQAGDPEQIERNESISVKRKLRRMRADCALMAMGHIHKLRICKPICGLWIVDGKQVYPETLIDPVSGGIQEDMRWYCSTGSFVKGFIEGVSTYVERAGYPPTELGMIKAEVRGGKVKNVEKAIL